MEKLIDALTRAANGFAAYYEAKALHENAITDTVPKKEIEKAVGAHIAAHDAMFAKLPADAGTRVTHGPKLPATPPPAAEPAAPAKRGRPKKEAAPAPAAAEPAIDPEFAGLTPEESEKRIFEVGEDLIGRFPTLGAPGPDGEPAPEGFHMLVGILKSSFKVERVTKLTPPQRLQFMSLVKARLSQAAPAVPAGEDPNAGV